MFDALEQSLKKTAFESLINELYTGVISKNIVCDKCNITRKNKEDFLDLCIMVKGLKGV